MKINKNIIIIIIGIAFLSGIAPLSFAQSVSGIPATNSAKLSPTEKPKENDTIESLKDKIEKKVDEINKKSKKIVVGLIESNKDNTLKINGDDSKEYTATIDATITKLFTANVNGLEEEKDLSGIKEKSRVIVSGPILEDQISANTIYLQEEYLVEQGQVTNVDKENFTIDVVTSEKTEMTLDIEKGTQQKILNTKTLELSNAGFSKYKVGDSIHFVSKKPASDEKKASAVRIVIIPQEFFTKDTSN
ncbi:hypothetical protein A3D06_01735 [Candidatus Roizmanbacteria bacterium RIFCSPHIGHO2_02_FULL_40_9]|uniref:DUF5666 domain-containing protein n=1 Tax=Candidatus Roizmanbacteria bacterium RIFCSPHIGHO2_02_FULL_40_9 TaxID=1802042 RepID=A0A1F7HCZ0_9BACT|nr:MAG: hypothetical protein A3D06_01735 [Candidatus Roizmanbacteria bacterium RIFCSPHIGHO2_02_FULL_40_9]